jgi:integrase
VQSGPRGLRPQRKTFNGRRAQTGRCQQPGAPNLSLVLTPRAIEAAKPRAARYGKADGLVPGLRVIVHPSGAKVFALFTRVNGRLVNFKLGSATVLSLAQAREEARRKLGLIAAGTDPRLAKQEAVQSEQETVETLVKQFIERHAKVHNRSWQETERLLQREVLSQWRGRPITSITRRDVIDLLDRIRDRGARIVANRTLAAMRKMFSWAIQRDLLQVSPCANVKAPSAEVKRERTLSTHELSLVWRAAGTMGYPFGSIVQLLILTAQRTGEVSTMRWCDLAASLDEWVIPPETAKNGKAHAVPLVPAARAILAGLPQINAFVFTTRADVPAVGLSHAKRELDTVVTTLNDGVALAPWRLHDLRRTAASRLAQLGTPPHVTEKVLNHTGGVFRGVAGIYNRFDYADEKRQALGAWAEHISALTRS